MGCGASAPVADLTTIEEICAEEMHQVRVVQPSDSAVVPAEQDASLPVRQDSKANDKQYLSVRCSSRLSSRQSSRGSWNSRQSSSSPFPSPSRFTDSRSTNSLAASKPTAPMQPCVLTPELPTVPPVINSDDVIDLKKYNDLLDEDASWDRDELPWTPVAVPFPPTRRTHEKYVRRINRFLLKMERDPSSVGKSVESKRDMAEMIKELLEQELKDPDEPEILE
ncbi:unnamed protein product [Durusdinium trenchii]|uniref:Uncharacterized protein n=1 Tax=Durusdinium trenchii TaxID=1381693 RepID=A0ABP0IA23_9DINO